MADFENGAAEAKVETSPSGKVSYDLSKLKRVTSERTEIESSSVSLKSSSVDESGKLKSAKVNLQVKDGK